MKQLSLPNKIKNILQDYIQSLRNIYKEDLVSAILYGSAASGEFTDEYSNINLLIVLNNTSLDNLNKMSKIINKHKFQLINPLFFTEDYIKSSLDVFPIEFLDIKENYVVLYGKDVLAGLEIDIKNLRFQCEQELKSKLLNLKSFYLRSKNRYALRNLLFKSITSIMHILRNLVRLKGRKPAYCKRDVLVEFLEEFNIDITNFEKVLEAKQKKSKLKYKEIESLFFSLVTDLEKIVDTVDKL